MVTIVVPSAFVEKFGTKDMDRRNLQGTGLGLYISKRIVEHHGGTIEGTNNKDGGATFAVILPTRSNLGKGTSKLRQLLEKSRLGSSAS